MKKINPFDLLIAVAILCLAVIIVFVLLPKKTADSKKTLVTVRTKTNISEVGPTITEGENTYLNSVNTPVKVDSTVMGVVDNQNYLDVTVEGQGSIEPGRYLFNGQRLLVGQKAELHGKFWIQGIITEVKYAN
jgi:hypothetical protein